MCYSKLRLVGGAAGNSVVCWHAKERTCNPCCFCVHASIHTLLMVIFEATKFNAYVLFSVLIAAQVFEAPSRPSQQLTSGDYGGLCQRELVSYAILWPLVRFGSPRHRAF